MDSPEAAEAAFYAAFAQTDVDAMKDVWAADADCLCIHPAGLPISGYAAIMSSWADILGASHAVELLCEPISRQHGPDSMVSTVYEHFKPPGVNAPLAPILATNVYRLLDGQWKLVLHHASPVVTQVQTLRESASQTRH